MTYLHTIILFVFLAVLHLLSGCATSKPLFQERYFWPPPPMPPRVEWLAAYHSQLDLESTPLRRFREAIVGEDAPIELIKPIEVRADAAMDKFYVADIGAAAVYIFDLRQNELRMLSKQGLNLPSDFNPLGLALDRTGNLYVLDSRLNCVFVFNSNEKFVRTIQLKLYCKRPLAIAIDKRRERMYISDAQLNKVFALDLSGALLYAIGESGDRKGQFNLPVGVSTNSKGDVIVAEAFNARIQVFDEKGTFLRTIGKRGDGQGDFQLIKSVAVDSDDNIYVADGRTHSIKVFDQAGEFLLILGGYYAVSSTGKKAPGGFAVPVGIDIDNRNRMFVVDQLNARVQVFQYLSSKAGLPALPPSKPVK